MANRIDKSLTNALCSAFSGTAVLCQVFFWIELLYYQRISDGTLKFMFYSAGLLVLIFTILIIHNLFRLAYYLSEREHRRIRGRDYA